MFRARDPESALILLHIPKTAGTTLAIILIGHYGQEHTKAVTGGDPGREAFAREPEAERLRPALFIGHQPFGIHEHVPRPCDYVTVIRDPVARVVSHYHHVLNETSHYLHTMVRSRKMTLLQYAQNAIGTKELDNGQTRMLADYSLNARTPVRSGSRDLLESAKQNLETHFCAVGLTERFDESMVMLAESLRWTSIPPYLPARVSGRSGRYPLSRDVTERIREINSLDAELYEWVAARFERQARELGHALADRVARIRDQNAAAAKAAAAPETPP